MPRLKDLTDQRVGKLYVKSFFGFNSKKRALFKCVCDCGNIAIVKGQDLSTALRREKGGTRSCGCLQRRQTPKPVPPDKIPRMWHTMMLEEVRIVDGLTTSQFHAQAGKTRSKHSECRSWRWTARTLEDRTIEVRRIR